MGKAKFFFAFLVGGLLGVGTTAQAGSFTVNPITVTLSGKDSSALLTLQSQTNEEVRFKIAVKEWAQDPKGEMQLKDTKDIVVFPGLLTLGAKEERKLRIGSTVSAGATERSYRVFVEELPPLKAPQTAGKSEVKVLTKMGIPIFIRPAKPAAAGAVGDMGLAKGKLNVTVKNTGNVHFMLQSVLIRAFDAGGAAVFEKKLEGWYVLAGGTRIWEVEIPKDACSKSKSVLVDVQADETKFSGRMDVPAAGCGP